jgi:AcrR family transcriptional regulator
MPEIAAEAELAPGTLYLHFPSKDALYAELLVEGYDILRRDLRAAANVAGPARVRAEALLDAFFTFARNHPEYFDIIFFILRKESSPLRETLPEEQTARLNAQMDACKEIAAQILGTTPRASKMELRATVDAMWRMLAGVVFFWQGDHRGANDPVIDRAKALILAAVFGP